MSQTWFQHTFSRKQFQTRNQAKALAILCIAIFLILGSLYLSQVASFAITNREIEELISQRDQLKRENEQLIGDIASYTTVPRLFARAVEIGFRPATNDEIDYILIPGYNPNRQESAVVISEAQTVDSPAIVYDETFSGWLEQQFDLLRQQFESFGE